MRFSLLLAALLFSACNKSTPAPAAEATAPVAQEKPTEEKAAAKEVAAEKPVENGSRTVEGKLVEAVAGDLGCYVSLELADGERKPFMADYELCDSEDLLEKRLKANVESVKYEMCEGGVGCGKFEERETLSNVVRL